MPVASVKAVAAGSNARRPGRNWEDGAGSGGDTDKVPKGQGTLQLTSALLAPGM
jgi:hypothetical protein